VRLRKKIEPLDAISDVLFHRRTGSEAEAGPGTKWRQDKEEKYDAWKVALVAGYREYYFSESNMLDAVHNTVICRKTV
jgi:hypothetical protein